MLSLIFIICSRQSAADMDIPLSEWGKYNIYSSQKLSFDIEKTVGKQPRWIAAAKYLESNSSFASIASPVGRLDIKYQKYWAACTGFFISNEYLMTAAHCVDPKDGPATEITIRMNYLDEADQKQWSSIRIDPTPAEYDRDLDYAILKRLPSGDSVNYGSLAISMASFKGHDNLEIIHHPKGTTKKISIYGCVSATPDPLVEGALIHECDTLGGSSGAPVLSRQNHTVVALHFGGATIPSSVRNYARPLSLIAQKSSILKQIIGHQVPPNIVAQVATNPNAKSWCKSTNINDSWFQEACIEAIGRENALSAKSILDAVGAFYTANIDAYKNYSGPRLPLGEREQCTFSSIVTIASKSRGEYWSDEWFTWLSSNELHECNNSPEYWIGLIRAMKQ